MPDNDISIGPADYALRGKRIWVAGHSGMVGSAICRRLAREDCTVLAVGHAELDLRRQTDVERWISEARPQAIIIAAARVGGIYANKSRPAEFIYDNLIIEANIIHAAHNARVEKLMMLGSSCIYPRLAPQPIPESALLTGELEPTNQSYAVAKIAGIQLARAYHKQYGDDFISIMPTNLYGPGDNFDPVSSHVIPALIAKAHDAKVEGAPDLEVWGTGKPRREFLFVEDLADAAVFFLTHYSGTDHVNVGTGSEISIRETVRLVCDIVGFEGEIRYESDMPDGIPRKLLDVSRQKTMGWFPKTELREGLALTYRWFLEAPRVRGRAQTGA